MTDYYFYRDRRPVKRCRLETGDRNQPALDQANLPRSLADSLDLSFIPRTVEQHPKVKSKLYFGRKSSAFTSTNGPAFPTERDGNRFCITPKAFTRSFSCLAKRHGFPGCNAEFFGTMIPSAFPVNEDLLFVHNRCLGKLASMCVHLVEGVCRLGGELDTSCNSSYTSRRERNPGARNRDLQATEA